MAMLRGAPLDCPKAELAVTVFRTEDTVARVTIYWRKVVEKRASACAARLTCCEL